MHILAHRGNVRGPDHDRENTLSFYREALEAGFGLEIDVRQASVQGETLYYISHDPADVTQENRLNPQFRDLFATHADKIIAVNVKELGYEDELARLLQNGVFGSQSFLFDFELLEPQTKGAAQQKIRALSEPLRSAPLAARLSDRNGETLQACLSLPAEVVWADEFDSLWLKQADIQAVQAAGRKVYAISPEIHGFSRAETQARWSDFAAWGIDGVCTDWAEEARFFFATKS